MHHNVSSQAHWKIRIVRFIQLFISLNSIEHILLLIRPNKIWQYVEYSRSPFLRLCAKSGYFAPARNSGSGSTLTWVQSHIKGFQRTLARAKPRTPAYTPPGISMKGHIGDTKDRPSQFLFADVETVCKPVLKKVGSPRFDGMGLLSHWDDSTTSHIYSRMRVYRMLALFVEWNRHLSYVFLFFFSFFFSKDRHRIYTHEISSKFLDWINFLVRRIICNQFMIYRLHSLEQSIIV